MVSRKAKRRAEEKAARAIVAEAAKKGLPKAGEDAAEDATEDAAKKAPKLGGRSGAHEPKAVPTSLPGFPGARRLRSKTSVRGGGGMHARWETPDGRVLEHDRKKGTVEVYDKSGKHQGEYNYDGTPVGKQEKGRRAGS